jgi:hypothetical protein
MPPQSRKGAGAKKVRRKEKKNVAHGHAHIKSTFNNTIVSITANCPSAAGPQDRSTAVQQYSSTAGSVQQERSTAGSVQQERSTEVEQDQRAGPGE